MKNKILVLAFLTIFVQAETIEPAKAVPTAAPTSSVSVSSLVTTSTNTSWVDQKIEEIKPQRNGLSSSALARLKSPFIVVIPKPKGDGVAKPGIKKAKTDAKKLLPTKKDMSKEPLTLQIVLNSSALINGKWLKENDTFRGYKLSQIQSNHVVMERKNKKIKLFIAQKSKNINISTK